MPAGICTGIAQAGSPSDPGQTIDGIAVVGGMTSSCGAVSGAAGGGGSDGCRCSGGSSATAPPRSIGSHTVGRQRREIYVGTIPYRRDD
ncbi:hypothetical protein GCM10010168_51950 [Actinoplanes ianthinogenes]|nr:hypothetical protein GCM10010168_51950 [Actinoplanes ianthinogenes]